MLRGGFPFADEREYQWEIEGGLVLRACPIKVDCDERGRRKPLCDRREEDQSETAADVPNEAEHVRKCNHKSPKEKVERVFERCVAHPSDNAPIKRGLGPT